MAHRTTADENKVVGVVCVVVLDRWGCIICKAFIGKTTKEVPDEPGDKRNTRMS